LPSNDQQKIETRPTKNKKNSNSLYKPTTNKQTNKQWVKQIKKYCHRKNAERTFLRPSRSTIKADKITPGNSASEVIKTKRKRFPLQIHTDESAPFPKKANLKK